MDDSTAIPEELQNGHSTASAASPSSITADTTSAASDARLELDGSSADSADKRAQKSRDEKIRQAKLQYEQERQRRVHELMEAQRQADEVRRRQEDERRRRIEDARRRDIERRRTVEERRRRLEQAELERKETLLKRLSDRESRADSLRTERRGRSGLPFAFGSSTPRDICEARAQSAHPACGTVLPSDAVQQLLLPQSAAYSAAAAAAAAAVSHRRAVSCAGRSTAAVGSVPDVSATDAAAAAAGTAANAAADEANSKQQSASAASKRIMSQSTLGLASTAVSVRNRNVSKDKPDALTVTSAVSSIDVSSSSRNVRTSHRSRITDIGGKSPSQSGKKNKADEERLQRLSQPRQPSVKRAELSPKTSPRMTASVTEESLRPTMQPAAKRQQQQLMHDTKRRAAPVAVNKQVDTHKSSLMTKSMIDLPSSKKNRVSVYQRGKKNESSDSEKMKQRPPTVTTPKKTQRQQPATAAAAASSATADACVPKSQSAQDLKSSAAPIAAEVEELRDTKQVTVSEILPDVDPNEAKRKFDEQRRLHREKLEAERRAEEERKVKEEEFRRRRVEEQKRREEETQAREEQQKKLKQEEDIRLTEEREQAKQLQLLQEKEAEEAQRVAREREEKERQEKLQAEEAARQERKKKLEAIMNRVKTGQAGSPTPDKQLPVPAAANIVAEAVIAAAAADQQQHEQQQQQPELPELPEQPDVLATTSSVDNIMTLSMPPVALSHELANNNNIANSSNSSSSASMAALAGRLKGTKAAEILARHSSSTQNLLAERTSPEHLVKHQQPATFHLSAANEAAADDSHENNNNDNGDEEVDNPALLTSNIETRLAEVRAKLSTTDNTSAHIEQVIHLQDKDDNCESGVSSPGTHCPPESPAQQQQHDNNEQQKEENAEQSDVQQQQASEQPLIAL